MAATVVVKLLEPLTTGSEPAGYWCMSRSIHARDVFSVEASASTDVAQVRTRIAAMKGLSEKSLRVFLFGKDLEDGRTLGSYGFGNIEDPLLHVIPEA